jgi:hypothetical protein
METFYIIYDQIKVRVEQESNELKNYVIANSVHAMAEIIDDGVYDIELTGAALIERIDEEITSQFNWIYKNKL